MVDFDNYLAKLVSDRASYDEIKTLFGIYSEKLSDYANNKQKLGIKLESQSVHFNERMKAFKEKLDQSEAKIRKESLEKEKKEKIEEKILTKKGKILTQERDKKEKEEEEISSIKDQFSYKYKESWPRIPSHHREPEFVKEFDKSELIKQAKELMESPSLYDKNVDTEKKYEYLFKEEVPGIHKDIKLNTEETEFIEPVEFEELGYKPFKNKLEEKISRELLNKTIWKLKNNVFTQKKI